MNFLKQNQEILLYRYSIKDYEAMVISDLPSNQY
uniref:Uncharacterized protein n=1 Tax=Rhizophora mucronata TaxID=61149 RepID=A0A2P2LR76_RHIMU